MASASHIACGKFSPRADSPIELKRDKALRCAGRLDETKQVQALEVLERNALAQQHIIEDILDASRIIAGKLRLDLSPVEIANIVEETVTSTKPSADAKGVELKTRIDPGTGLVVCDPSRFQQILWNLLSNAVKFTPRGGKVEVAVERFDSNVRLTVSDTGQGISEEFLPFVFDRFRQADSSTTRQFGGLGLGLAIVRHLAELHGGSVSVSSAGEGQGSCFTVTMPLTPPLTAAAEVLNETDVKRISAENIVGVARYGGSLAGLKILAVDDEADVRELLTLILTECGADVRAVASSQDAQRSIAEWQPHVLISDIAMPEENGLTLIRRVRALASDKGGNIPAIALTAYAHDDDRLKAIDAGYHTPVAKPVEPLKLIAVVTAAAGRARNTAA